MENAYGVNTENIKVGDRVEVLGCTPEDNDKHWGEAIEQHDEDWFVRMDDETLDYARHYDLSESVGMAYLAYDFEITQHIPAGKVALHEGKPVNIEAHRQPEPGAPKDIQTTLDYLKATTNKEWVAVTDGIQLDITGSGEYGGEMTIKFIQKGCK